MREGGVTQVQTSGAAVVAGGERAYTDLERLLAKELGGSRELPLVNGVVVPKSAEGIYRLAAWYVGANLVPDSLRGGDEKATTSRVAIAIMAGASVGLNNTQAMSSIMIVNNRPSMWGDALVAIVRASPQSVEIVDSDANDTATCRAVRMKLLPDGTYHRETAERSFSMRDAERAGLTNKGPWKSNPARMRQNRARAFALRDLFADLLMGIGFAEEEQDIADMRRTERVAGSTEAARGAAASLGAPEPAPAPDAPQTPATSKPVPEGGIGLPRKTKDDTTAHGPGDAPRTVAGEGNTTPANPDPSAAAGNGAKAGGQTTTPTGANTEPTDADLAASLGKDLFPDAAKGRKR